MTNLIIKSYKAMLPEEKKATYNELVLMAENGIILLDPWLEVIEPKVNQEIEQEDKNGLFH